MEKKEDITHCFLRFRGVDIMSPIASNQSLMIGHILFHYSYYSKIDAHLHRHSSSIKLFIMIGQDTELDTFLISIIIFITKKSGLRLTKVTNSVLTESFPTKVNTPKNTLARIYTMLVYESSCISVYTPWLSKALKLEEYLWKNINMTT